MNEVVGVSTRVIDKIDSSSRVNDKASSSGQSPPSQPLRMTQCSRRVVSQLGHYLSLIETKVIILNDDIKDPSSYKQTRMM